MADALITEHAGTRRGEISRFYQYGSGGVRVMDAKKAIKRLYRFDPSSDSMTERDPVRQEKVLRRFVYDRYGMLEETFAFGARPRTFRYENGASRIAVREGGEYGAVGKIFTFEQNGITETAWGRNGEIERVYQLDSGGDAITERAGGWYGDVVRTIVFSGIDASLFLKPEAFLQFLMFTEWSTRDREEDVNERVASIRSGEMAGSQKSRYAYTGPKRTPGIGGVAGGRGPDSRIPVEQNDARSERNSPRITSDAGIDYIPDADALVQGVSKEPVSRRSSGISFEERWHRPDTDDRKMSMGKSVEIPLEERFGSARGEREELSKGKSVEIPLEERFESARREREKLSKGKSTEIPYDERRSGGNR